jgi:hypothetical protein
MMGVGLFSLSNGKYEKNQRTCVFLFSALFFAINSILRQQQRKVITQNVAAGEFEVH